MNIKRITPRIAYANIQTIMDEKTHLREYTIYCRVYFVCTTSYSR